MKQENAFEKMEREREERRAAERATEQAEAAAAAQRIKRYIALGGSVLFGALVFTASCNSIDTGTVGVVKHFGAVQPHVLTEGINFTRPWPMARH